MMSIFLVDVSAYEPGFDLPPSVLISSGTLSPAHDVLANLPPPIYFDYGNDAYDDRFYDDDVLWVHPALRRFDGGLFDMREFFYLPCSHDASYSLDDGSQINALKPNQAPDQVAAVSNNHPPPPPLSASYSSSTRLISQHAASEAVISHPEPLWLAAQHYGYLFL